MGFIDVISGRQSFTSWVTGRDSKADKAISVNYNGIKSATSELKSVATYFKTTSQPLIEDALNKLCSINGMTEYSEEIGTNVVNASTYTPIFEYVPEVINSISKILNDKADAVREWENTGWIKKAASTVTMGLCKLGEGLLSVVEDLGDGVVSVVGFVGGKLGATNLQNAAADLVKKEWSHDAFNIYYNSDFAKASAFTEDSALAGGIKIIGKSIGYMYAGGAIAGAASSAFGSSVGIAGKVVGAMGKVASSTTWGATAAGLIGGMGSGTEASLNAGADYNTAIKAGLKTGAIQGGLAFVGGKIGEGAAKHSATKAAEKSLEKAKEAAESSSKIFEVNDAKEALSTVKNMKMTEFQGYNDVFTKSGMKFGSSLVDTTKSGVTALTKTAAASKEIIKGNLRKGSLGGIDKTNQLSQAASDAQEVFKENFKELALHNNPVSQVVSKPVNAVKTVVQAASGKSPSEIGTSLVTYAKEGAKNAGTKLIDVVKHPIQTTKTVAGAVINTATPGAVAAASGAVLSESLQKQGASAFQYDAQTSTDTSTYTDTGSADSSYFQLDTNPISTVVKPDGGSTYTIGSGTTTGGGTSTGGSTYTTGGGASSGGYANGGGVTTGGNSGLVSGGSSTGTGYQTPTLPTIPETATLSTNSVSTPTISTNAIQTTAIPTNTTRNTSIPTETVSTIAPSTTSLRQTDTNNGYIPSAGASIGYSGGGSYSNNGASSGSSGMVDYSNHSGTEFSGIDGKEDDLAASLDSLIDDTTLDSIDEIIKGSKYNRIPTSQKPINAQKANGESSTVIPVAAGLSVASAAALGAKAYMDHKKNNGVDDEEYEFADDEEDGLVTENWSDTIEETQDDSTDQEFINQDKQGEDEYYRTSENPLPMFASDVIEEY